MQKRDLTETFNRLQSAHPELVAEATGLDMGQWGLVADHRDGTVTKILFRQDAKLQQDWAEANLNNEIAFLRLMGGKSFDGIQIPALVEDITPIVEGEFFAAYRMRKIPGHFADWKNETTLPPNHFYEAGKVMAQFHAAMAMLDSSTLSVHPPEKGVRVAAVPSLDAGRNRALEIAGEYIQAHRERGIIHGDYHGRNILLNEQGRITGLLDFAVTGPAENWMFDIINVAEPHRSAFMKGYESASGKPVDPMMMTMTEISLLAGCINYYADQPEQQQKWMHELDEHLRDARPVTGYTPA